MVTVIMLTTHRARTYILDPERQRLGLDPRHRNTVASSPCSSGICQWLGISTTVALGHRAGDLLAARRRGGGRFGIDLDDVEQRALRGWPRGWASLAHSAASQDGGVQALLIKAFGEVPRLTTVPDPACPADGAVVEVAATGLCRKRLARLDGP